MKISLLAEFSSFTSLAKFSLITISRSETTKKYVSKMVET